MCFKCFSLWIAHRNWFRFVFCFVLIIIFAVNIYIFEQLCTSNWELCRGAEASKYIWLSKSTSHFYLIVLNLCNLKKCILHMVIFVNICSGSQEKKMLSFFDICASSPIYAFIINSLYVILETDSQIGKRRKESHSCNGNLPSDDLLPAISALQALARARVLFGFYLRNSLGQVWRQQVFTTYKTQRIKTCCFFVSYSTDTLKWMFSPNSGLRRALYWAGDGRWEKCCFLLFHLTFHAKCGPTTEEGI